MSYEVVVEIKDKFNNQTVFISRESEDVTWPWMLDVMIDALTASGFTLPAVLMAGYTTPAEGDDEEYFFPYNNKIDRPPQDVHAKVDLKLRSGRIVRNTTVNNTDSLWECDPAIPDYPEDVVGWKYSNG